MPVRSFHRGTERDGFTWPLGGADAAGLPAIASWRQWGHSWTGGFDAPVGETGFPERLAGVLGVRGSSFENYGVFGSAIMDATNRGSGYYLQNTTRPAAYNVWPWEPYHGIDGFLWGVNDFGTRWVTGMILTGPDPWPTQRDMWRGVWREAWRSVIQRSIAGGVFPGERIVPTSVSTPTTGDHPTVVYGGPGGGGWTFSPFESSGAGMWRTGTSGATVTITVPADYDTGYIAVRHLVPGSYFPGAQTIYAADGTGPYVDPPGPAGPPIPTDSNPAMYLGSTASETFLAPNTITTATAGVTSVVRDPRILRDRLSANALTGAATIVDRIAVPITPGTTRTVTITVGTIPVGGWYAFDSWEIESKMDNRPPVIVANVVDPYTWGAIYFLGINTWPGMFATSQLASDDVAAVCAEYADPGICVADVRTAFAGHEIDYGGLYRAGDTPLSTHGDASPTGILVGDGTHPHSIGSRLAAGAFRDALVKAAIPTSRYALAFGPERDMVRA